MKYIKLYTESSQYTNTDFYFPHVSFQEDKINGYTNTIRATRDTHALHLFTDEYMLKCTYKPAEHIRLFNKDAKENLVWYVYKDKKYSNKVDELTFEEAPTENIVAYFLFKDNTQIPANMFMNCKCLINIEFSDSIYKINKRAFMGCTHLKEIVLPTNCMSVGKYAFANCTDVTRIVFNDKLRTVRMLAFQMGSKQIPNVEFVNLKPFSKISNKRGILFKHLKTDSYRGNMINRKNIRLATYFSPDFFKNKTHEEKIQWANLLCGDLLANIFYYDEDLLLRTTKFGEGRGYSIIIPEGVRNMSTLFVPINTSNEHVKKYLSETRTGDTVLLDAVSAYAEQTDTLGCLYKVHIPNSVSNISYCFFNIIHEYKAYRDGNTKDTWIRFYLDKTRDKAIGISRGVVYTNTMNYADYLKGTRTLMRSTFSFIHVLKSTYYKHICTRYNRWQSKKYQINSRSVKSGLNVVVKGLPRRYRSFGKKLQKWQGVALGWLESGDYGWSNRGWFHNINFIYRYFGDTLVTRIVQCDKIDKYYSIDCKSRTDGQNYTFYFYRRTMQHMKTHGHTYHIDTYIKENTKLDFLYIENVHQYVKDHKYEIVDKIYLDRNSLVKYNSKYRDYDNKRSSAPFINVLESENGDIYEVLDFNKMYKHTSFIEKC